MNAASFFRSALLYTVLQALPLFTLRRRAFLTKKEKQATASRPAALQNDNKASNLLKVLPLAKVQIFDIYVLIPLARAIATAHSNRPSLARTAPQKPKVRLLRLRLLLYSARKAKAGLWGYSRWYRLSDPLTYKRSVLR